MGLGVQLAFIGKHNGKWSDKEYMIIYYHCTRDSALSLLLSFLITCHPYIMKTKNAEIAICDKTPRFERKEDGNFRTGLPLY